MTSNIEYFVKRTHTRVCECSLCTKCQYKYVHVLVLSIVTGSVVGLVQMKHLIILYINIEKKNYKKKPSCSDLMTTHCFCINRCIFMFCRLSTPTAQSQCETVNSCSR